MLGSPASGTAGTRAAPGARSMPLPCIPTAQQDGGPHDQREPHGGGAHSASAQAGAQAGRHRPSSSPPLPPVGAFLSAGGAGSQRSAKRLLLCSCSVLRCLCSCPLSTRLRTAAAPVPHARRPKPPLPAGCPMLEHGELGRCTGHPVRHACLQPTLLRPAPCCVAGAGRPSGRVRRRDARARGPGGCCARLPAAARTITPGGIWRLLPVHRAP